MQSSSLVALFAVAFVVAAASDEAWDGTHRDFRAQCLGMVEGDSLEVKCKKFNHCCLIVVRPMENCNLDVTPLNVCDVEKEIYKCTYKNCTMLTTTTTTTTPAPPRAHVNAVSGVSLFMALSALLPRFLF